MKHAIEQFGWTVMLVEATPYLPGFAYTIGLWQNFGHPEIIAFGLSTNTLHLSLNTVGEMVKAGRKMEFGKIYTDEIFEQSDVQFLQVDQRNVTDYFGQAIEYYNSADFPALQLVWTDRNNKFPWEEGFETEFEFRQPLLDRNAAFKFKEAKNLGVFTTRQWLELGKPVLHVVHDTDGDWQFLSGDQMPDDARLLALEQIVLKDPTLNEVFNLDYGESAHREYLGGPWTRSKIEEE
jgi:hypothetical protein